MDAAIADFHGDDRLVADYVRDEFLAELDDETLDFLFATSVLDRSPGTSATRFSNGQGSADVLAPARSLEPPDHSARYGRDQVYRHHSMLQEMLQSELGRLDDASVSARLHVRASEWFSDQGDIDRAVPHAIQSGDRELAAEPDLAVLALHTCRPGGRQRSAAGSTLHRGAAATSPELCLARATVPPGRWATEARSSGGPESPSTTSTASDAPDDEAMARGGSHHPRVWCRARRRDADEGRRSGWATSILASR